jgi:hypothetical protein
MYQLFISNFEITEDILPEMGRDQKLVAALCEKETINLYGGIFCGRDVLK